MASISKRGSSYTVRIRRKGWTRPASQMPISLEFWLFKFAMQVGHHFDTYDSAEVGASTDLSVFVAQKTTEPVERSSEAGFQRMPTLAGRT